ncbi:hypothetical protein [Actinoallomurus rhizosphaericola]|uniref:hypothetical protein n=1 Tax=Actinoallomurus rhizosphaericola TaxID=2952536 RepID=UPI002090C304|nr:hypothetical protein [Actinoallomurus rhizosphaericola]MCO5994385.1 hypothetical protein [Actinoallomurus rhizosphaericola]
MLTKRLTIRLLGGTAVAGTLLLGAACGGGKTSTQSGQQTGQGGGPNAGAMSAYRQCMEKQGVTMPSRGPGGGPGMGAPGGRPSGNPSGMPSGRPTARPSGRPSGMPSMSAAQKKAAQACASLRPTAPGNQNGPAQPTG